MENKVEVAATQYYVHRSYVNVYYYLYEALENWIASNIFRNDKTRVFLASNDYAFRRRFELTDMSIDYSKLEFSSLNFPFANYWPQNSGWKPDTRPAANQAYMIYGGMYLGDTKFRVAPGIITIPVTFYFDREDDARLAYENLYFYTYNEHYFSTVASISNTTVGIPMNISFNNLQFNPSFKETDWLKKNRIFIITVNLDLRSFIIKPPEQPDYYYSVNQNGDLIDGTGAVVGDYKDGYPSYCITKEVILNLKDYEDLYTSTITVDGVLDESQLEINYLRVKENTLSPTQVTIEWECENPSDIISIKIRKNSIESWTSISKDATEYTILGLTENSTYNFEIEFLSEKYGLKQLWLAFTTPESLSTLTKKESSKASLIGLKF